MKQLLAFLSACLILHSAQAQFSRDSIRTDFVLYQRRLSFDNTMRNRTIAATFAEPLDSTTEDSYREACWAISQFLLHSPVIEKGFAKLFAGYTLLERSTKRALLEAVYGTYPSAYILQTEALIRNEKDPKLFAIQAVYLQRAFASDTYTAGLVRLLEQNFPGYSQQPVLCALYLFLQQHPQQVQQPTPLLQDLFAFRKALEQKTIYSFQRWNRDYPGLAIIQQADGSFCRDSAGKLLVFEQLARSASDLPYFITNGSTPQGVFSIQGTAVSHNYLIGPTPNIQLVMPFEADSAYWQDNYDTGKDTLNNYLALLPPSWRSYLPVQEVFYAGRAGRTEIIAHGSAINPDYFKDRPYYPLTPTMGCLSAKESWNSLNGSIEQSEQLRLVNAFLSTPGDKGHLFVINLDNQQQKVTPEEVERLVAAFETKQ